MTRPDDEDLMLRIRRERCAEAFKRLMERYRQPVLHFLSRIVRDDSAVDLTQEVFLRVWTRSEQWDGHGRFRSWLFRIATNLALNQLRTVRRRREQPLELPPPELEDESAVPAWMIDAASLGPEQAAELHAQRDRLRRLVEELPEEKREVMRLIQDAGLEPREIAAELGIPEGTVRSRLYHARRRLAKDWQEDDTE